MTTQELRDKLEKRGVELSKLQGDYFSNIQFPGQWIETGVKDLKQDVNAGRRTACKNHHAWGYQKGYNSLLDITIELAEALERINKEGNTEMHVIAFEALAKLQAFCGVKE